MPDTVKRLNLALSGRYRVERELGRGGMATVYLAHDERHGRRVAIKVLRPDLGERMGAERFGREIEIAARLNHPNILPLFDSGSADGLRFFVMPYIEGETLRDRLADQGPLSLEEAVQIGGEIGEALQYAHDQGLVHRDIKPANILFQAGHALVCDFGIAKAFNEARDDLTKTGFSVGTIAYMSPEQLVDGHPVDGRSDLYALGCLLYEMLEGDPPFAASTPQAAMAKKLMGELPAAPQRADVPATVRQVMERALAPDPSERHPSAGAFVSALRGATTSVEIERDARRRGRAKLFRLSAVGAIAVTLTAAGWWAWARGEAPTYERIAVLPFANAGADSATDYFVHGIHEDLVLALQRAGLRVINSRSVQRYGADSPESITEIASELVVDAVVEGSARLDGRRVEVELQLIDPVTEEVVWTRPFESDERDVLALLSTMTRAIAVEAGVPLTAEAEARLAQTPAVDEVLYEMLLQARFERSKLTAESLDRAEDYLELALARDSTSADAWVGMSQVWGFRAQQGLVSPEDGRLRATAALERARTIDPELGRNHSANALRMVWPEWPAGQWEAAEAAFLAALDEDPSDATTRAYYALFLLYLGRREEGERQTDWAALQAPDDALVQGLHGQALNALHRSQEAERALLRARRFNPDAPMILTTLRTVYHLTGQHERAIEAWRDSFRTTNDPEALAALERGYAMGGYSDALAAVAELFVERSSTERVRPWSIGTLFARAGRNEEAIDYLAAAVREGDPNLPYLCVDPIFDPLRGDPRFEALVDEVGLPGLTPQGAG